MSEHWEDERARLQAARYADDLREAIAALDDMQAQRQYDLVLDALSDERDEVRQHAAGIATRLLEATTLDLSRLPAEISFSTYFGATELEEMRALARPRGENVAGMLALFWPRIEATLRAMSEEEFAEAQRQSRPFQKIGLKLPGSLLFKARLLAWKFDCSPAAVLHVTCALGRRLPEFAP